MPDSQSSEPGFESPFATVSKIGHFSSLHWRPSWLSCINEYLAIDSGGNVSDLVVARNCCMARMLSGEAELVSEWTGLSGRAKSVKRFERSDGLDIALYKTTFTFFKKYAEDHSMQCYLRMTWCYVKTLANKQKSSWNCGERQSRIRDCESPGSGV